MQIILIEALTSEGNELGMEGNNELPQVHADINYN